ncbi:hypothetical protein M2375_001672 [Comamonas sp. BIGb0152]|nr:hypothetical protein [Comamonas sp. BIGb0152]
MPGQPAQRKQTSMPRAGGFFVVSAPSHDKAARPSPAPQPLKHIFTH